MAESINNQTLYAVVNDLKQSGEPLKVDGLSLVDVIEYDMLRVFGRLFLNVNETQGGNHAQP